MKGEIKAEKQRVLVEARKRSSSRSGSKSKAPTMRTDSGAILVQHTASGG